LAISSRDIQVHWELGDFFFVKVKMVLNIYVARHGQDRDNSNGILNGHRDEPLTELGR